MQNILRYTVHKNKSLLVCLLKSQKGVSLHSVPACNFADNQDQSQKGPRKPRIFQSREANPPQGDKPESKPGIFSRQTEKAPPRVFGGKEAPEAAKTQDKPEGDVNPKLKTPLFAQKKPKEQPQTPPKVTTLFSHDAQQRAAQEKEKEKREAKETQTPPPKKKEIKLFGKKEVESGFILDRLAKDLQKEVEEAVPEMTAADRNTIVSRINTLKQLENVPKKFQNLMELYLLLGEPQNAQKVYMEAQKHKMNKNPLIENLMFEASIADSYPKAQEFYNYLKENNKLDEVLYNTMCQYIELQCVNDTYHALRSTIQDLKAIDFNLVDLDIAPFYKFLGLDKPNPVGNNPEKIHEFLEKCEVFIDLFAQVLRKRPPHAENYAFVFKFQHFFRVLNNLNYPHIKLDSSGNDIVLYYLEVLGKAGLLNANFIDFADFCKWMACYYTNPIAFPKIASLIAQIPANEPFFAAFRESLNDYIANHTNPPFDVDTLRAIYSHYREEAIKNKVGLTHNFIQFFIELAQAHRQYDLIFDIYENFGKLAQTHRYPAYIYKNIADIFTYLNLASKNCYEIVTKLFQEAETKHDIKIGTLFSCFTRVKALIKDGKYEDAHGIFEGEFLNNYIVKQQKVLLYAALNLTLMESMSWDGKEEDQPPDFSTEIAAIKDWVDDLSREDLISIYKRLQDSTEYFKQFISNPNLQEHFNYWTEYEKNPPDADKLLEEYQERKKKLLQESAAALQEEHKQAREAGKSRRERLIMVETSEGMKTPAQVEEMLNPYREPKKTQYDEENDILFLETEQARFEEVDFENLNNDVVVEMLSGQNHIMQRVKKLIKLPLDEKHSKRGDFESIVPEKAVTEYVNDFIMWGIYNNEPLGNV